MGIASECSMASAEPVITVHAKTHEEAREYKKLSAKFPRALGCGIKYKWSVAKCIDFGKQIESKFLEEETPADQVEQAAVDMIIAAIRAERDEKANPHHSKWKQAVAELQQNGYAVIENAISIEQVSRILAGSRDYLKEVIRDDSANALTFSADFLDLIDVPDVLDVAAHWLGPN